MQIKSLRDAIADAEKESPTRTGGGGGEWDAGKTPVEVVNANVNTKFETPRIGLQLQRTSDGRRRWFDLYFDPENAKGYAMTGRKLKDLGADAIMDAAAEQYPVDANASETTQQASFVAQLEVVASSLRNVRFVADIQKVESKKNAPNAVDAGSPEAEADPSLPLKGYVNYFTVAELLEGPTGASDVGGATGGFSGFGNGTTPGLMG